MTQTPIVTQTHVKTQTRGTLQGVQQGWDQVWLIFGPGRAITLLWMVQETSFTGGPFLGMQSRK